MNRRIHMRWLSFTFLGLCMFGGLIAGLFSPSIQAALTLQQDNGNHQGGPVKMPVATTTKQPSPTSTGVTILARDTFQRAAQVLWGTASDGRQWMGDANSIEVFSIAGNAGQVDHGQGTFNALLGPMITNAEIVFSGTVNHFAQGKVNMGAVLRWTDDHNWYKALSDGSKLEILKRVKGTATQLGSIPFSAQEGVPYTLRFRVLGAALFVKAWQSNQPEPPGWTLRATDTSAGLTTGFGGIRVLVHAGTVIRVTSFLETTVSNVV